MNHPILNIATECILAKVEGRLDDLLHWSERLAQHPHRGPAKDVFFDMLVEPIGIDAEYYRDFLTSLEEEVSSSK